jgi:hypothetical protein
MLRADPSLWGTVGGNDVKSGVYEITFPMPQAPEGLPQQSWSRFRLDYGENAGQDLAAALPHDVGPSPGGKVRFWNDAGGLPVLAGGDITANLHESISAGLTATYALSKGLAQFGEVEDYKVLLSNFCSLSAPVREGTFFVDTTGASTDGPSACGGIGSDEWFCYTATCSGTATVRSCGSEFDTVIAAYDGCGCPPASALTCNDDSCGPQSQITLSVVEGSSYLIQVGGHAGASGDGTLQISCSGCSPGAVRNLVIGADETTMSWDLIAGGPFSYDLAYARLNAPHFTGSFSAFAPPGPGGSCMSGCNRFSLNYPIGCKGTPPAGAMDMWIVRGRGSCNVGTWNEGGIQAGNRDAGPTRVPSSVCP